MTTLAPGDIEIVGMTRRSIRRKLYVYIDSIKDYPGKSGNSTWQNAWQIQISSEEAGVTAASRGVAVVLLKFSEAT